MKYLFSTLLILLASGLNLHAQSMGRGANGAPQVQINPSTIINNATPAVPLEGQHGSATGPTLPAGCREETCHSSPDPVGGIANCHRYICGGNWWGDSAVDIIDDGTTMTEGEGALRATYSVFQIRLPKREYSVDPWQEAWFQSSGPYCGYGITPENRSSSSSSLNQLISNIIPSLFAAPSSEHYPLFTPEELGIFYRSLLATLHNLEAALNRSSPSEVGAFGSEQAAYIGETADVMRFVLYDLRNQVTQPSSDPSVYCPTRLASLCEMTSSHLNIYSSERPCGIDAAGGCTPTPDSIEIAPYLFGISYPPGSLGLQKVILHEATHIVQDFADGTYAPVGYREGPISNGEIGYSAETRANLVASIGEHFFIRGPIFQVANRLFGDGDLYDILMQDPSLARIRAFDEPHIDYYFGDDAPHFRGFGLPIIGVRSLLLRRQLEDQFQKDGGVARIRGEVHPIASPFFGSSLHTDSMTSPLHAAPGTPSGLTVGPPPAQGSNAPVNRDVGHQPNAAGYTPPSNQVPLSVATGRDSSAHDVWCRAHPSGACNPPNHGTPTTAGGSTVSRDICGADPNQCLCDASYCRSGDPCNDDGNCGYVGQGGRGDNRSTPASGGAPEGSSGGGDSGSGSDAVPSGDSGSSSCDAEICLSTSP